MAMEKFQEETMKAIYMRRLLIIISLAVIWSLVLIRLVFKPSLLHAFAQNRAAFSVIACAVILSLCFYYYVARKHPHFAIGLAVLAVGVVLVSVCGVAGLVLHFDSVWLDRFMNLGEALCCLTPLIFIWQAMKKSRTENNENSRSRS